jgi:hypothetical protein
VARSIKRVSRKHAAHWCGTKRHVSKIIKFNYRDIPQFTARSILSPAIGLVNCTQNVFLKSTFYLYGFINEQQSTAYEQACNMSQE